MIAKAHCCFIRLEDLNYFTRRDDDVLTSRFVKQFGKPRSEGFQIAVELCIFSIHDGLRAFNLSTRVGGSFIEEAARDCKLFQNRTRSPAATLVPLSTFVSRSLITTAYASVSFDSAWS